MRTLKFPFLLTALSATALLAACDGKDDVSDDTSTPDTTEADTDTDTDADTDTDTDADTDTDTDTDADYTLSITAPAGGDTVGASTTMTYTVDGLTLDPDAMGDAHDPGNGHVHIYLDGVYQEATGELSYTFTDLEAGAHELGAVLAQNDHIEYAETLQTVSVTVGEDGDPLVVISSPDFGSDTVGSSVELGLLVSNFNVVDSAGGTATDGEGHYHIYIDGTYYGFDTDPDSTLVTDLTPGEHDIRIVLANNDHTELDPQIDDTIEINVPANSPSINIEAPSEGESIDSATVPVSVSIGRKAALDTRAVPEAFQ